MRSWAIIVALTLSVFGYSHAESTRIQNASGVLTNPASQETTSAIYDVINSREAWTVSPQSGSSYTIRNPSLVTLGTFSSINTYMTASCDGYTVASFVKVSGAHTGGLAPQLNYGDDNWLPTGVYNATVSSAVSQLSFTNPTTSIYTWPLEGCVNVRVAATTFTSSTATFALSLHNAAPVKDTAGYVLGSQTASDAMANPSATGLLTIADMMGFNGSTWTRIASSATNSLITWSIGTASALHAKSHTLLYDPTNGYYVPAIGTSTYGSTVYQPVDHWEYIATTGTSGIDYMVKFGYNSGIGTTAETVWSGGGLYSYPTSAVTMTIVSTDANDSSADNGARTVYIEGLDSNYTLTSETISMSGTVSVTTANAYLRVYRMYVATAGSTGGNEGTITLQRGSTVYARIDPPEAGMTTGDGQTLMAVYTIPANKTGYMTQWHVTMQGSTSDMECKLRFRPFGGSWRTVDHQHGYSRPIYISFQPYNKFTAKTDIEVQCYKSAVGGDIEVSAGFDILLR